jgi:pimeloyl-ACP methyl ester carboxylesterase
VSYLPLEIQLLKLIEARIIAVHGLGANPATTWMKEGVNWLNDPRMLPAIIPFARIWTFNFQSNWLGDAPRLHLAALGDQLLEFIRLKIAHGNKSIIFVAHSFGGIVVAQALCSNSTGSDANQILDLVKGVAFLGTPFRGSTSIKYARQIVNVAEAFGFEGSKALLDRLLPEDRSLVDLVSNFGRLAAAKKLDIVCFFEELKTVIIKKPWKPLKSIARKVKVLVVSEDAACLDTFRKLGLGTCHTQMNEFDSPEDGNYQMVAGELAYIAKRSLEPAEAAAKVSDPKARPIIFWVPCTLNPGFVGREDILKEIDNKMIWKEGTQNRVALWGLGGMGKTQIALKYAYRNRRKFEADGISLFWVHGGSREKFEYSYLELAKKVGLDISSETSKDLLGLVADWLRSEGNGRWVMIVDNADDIDVFRSPPSTDVDSSVDPDTGLLKYMPYCEHGAILFTSRSRGTCVDVAGPSSLIPIRKLGEDDCELFLRNSLQEDQCTEGTERLLDMLECLPLALAQAVSYMNKVGISISEYLKLFEENEAVKLKLLSMDFQGVEQDRVSNAVAATWIISFRQIESKSTDAAWLLSFMSFLDRQDIPKELIPRGTLSSVEFEGALGILKSYSMISPGSSESYNMHGLIQLSMRNWLKMKKFTEVFTQDVLQVLNEVFPDSSNVENWPTCARYHLHAQAILDYISYNLVREDDFEPDEHQRFAIEDEIELLSKLGCYLSELHQFRNATVYQLRLVEVSIRWGGLGFKFSIEGLYALIGSNIELGQYPEALCLLRAYHDYHNLLDDQPELEKVKFMLQFGSVLDRQGHCELAMCCYWGLALSLRKLYGNTNHWSMVSKHCLGTAMSNHGSPEYLEFAEGILKDLLGTRLRVNGPVDPLTLGVKESLAEVFSKTGQHVRAGRMYYEVFCGRRENYGSEHPWTLRSLVNFANAYRNPNCWPNSVKPDLHVQFGAQRVIGDENSKTLAVMYSLACDLRKLEFEETASAASIMMGQVVKLSGKILGSNDSRTHESARTLAEWTKDSDNLIAASKAKCDIKREYGNPYGLAVDDLGSPETLGPKLRLPPHGIPLYEVVKTEDPELANDLRPMHERYWGDELHDELGGYTIQKTFWLFPTLAHALELYDKRKQIQTTTQEQYQVNATEQKIRPSEAHLRGKTLGLTLEIPEKRRLQDEGDFLEDIAEID